ncbi:MAG: hemolysin family protein [Solirubrobacterales bacterium]
MTALLIFAVIALLAVNAFFVAAEFALVRANIGRLQAVADEGGRGARSARRALRQREELTRYLSACQLGVTLASLGLGFLGEPAVASLFEELLGVQTSDTAGIVISIALAYLVVTAVTVVGSELVPKVFAIVHAERVARFSSGPLGVFELILRPFIALLSGSANVILRVLRIDPSQRLEEGGTPDDIKLLITQAETGGTLDENEADMLEGVFHLHEQEARQVMTPIPAVVTVDDTDDVETALRRCVDSGHTRLVVMEEGNPDNVIGTVHANSLVRQYMQRGPQADLKGLVKPALILPETKPLDDLLADLQRERSTLAVIVDEYGRPTGVVTVEDVVEEVVGEIDDETDPAAGAIRQLATGEWYVRGHVALSDLPDYGIELPDDNEAYNSVGGLVFSELGRLPQRGDVINIDGYSLRVDSVRENRVTAVRIRPLAAGAAGPDPEERPQN